MLAAETSSTPRHRRGSGATRALNLCASQAARKTRLLVTCTRLVVVLEFDVLIVPRADESSDVRDALFGGRVRFAKLTEFFLAVSMHNVLLALISCTHDEKLIAQVLAAAGLSHFFGARIFGRTAVEQHGGKATVLLTGLIEPLGQRAADFLIVDTSEQSCGDMRSLGCATVLQRCSDEEGRIGLGPAEFNAVHAWVEARLGGADAGGGDRTLLLAAAAADKRTALVKAKPTSPA